MTMHRERLGVMGNSKRSAVCWLVLIVACFSVAGFAHDGHSHGGGGGAGAARAGAERIRRSLSDSATGGQITGALELRPSWKPSAETYDTDNIIRVGYLRNADTEISYNQEFGTNLNDPARSGLGFRLHHGYLGGNFNNLWINDAMDTAFSYEARLYLPTDTTAREGGLVTSIRNYLKLVHDLTDTITLSVSEVVVIPIYSQAAAIVPGGLEANPIFQNQLYLTARLSVTDELALSLPLSFYMTRHAHYESHLEPLRRALAGADQ